MADNSSIPVAVGNETFANNEIAGVKYPRVKLVWGAAGAANDASVANPVPISGTVTANVGTGIQAVSGTVTANVGTMVPLVAGTAHIGEVKIDPTQLGTLVAGAVPVVSGGYEFQAVAASQTGTVLQVSAGATGDYLESILCVVATPATSKVMIGDGAAPAIVILPDNVGGGVGSYPIPLGLTSKTGSWRVTTAAGVSIIATGNFS